MFSAKYIQKKVCCPWCLSNDQYLWPFPWYDWHITIGSYWRWLKAHEPHSCLWSSQARIITLVSRMSLSHLFSSTRSSFLTPALLHRHFHSERLGEIQYGIYCSEFNLPCTVPVNISLNRLITVHLRNSSSKPKGNVRWPEIIARLIFIMTHRL